MPKKQNKVLTATIYAYTEPQNRKFAVMKARREHISGGVSGYVNDLIAADRAREEKKSALQKGA